MKLWKPALKQWTLALASITSLFIGAFALQACGGEGGSVGGNGGGGTGDPSITQQFRSLLTEAQRTATYVGSDKCGSCHGGTQEGDDLYAHWKDTKHFSKEVGCESCHGPGSAHAVSPAATNILTFPKVMDSVVCGQCHGPTFADWQASPHARIIETPIHDSASVDTVGRYKGSQCMNCHSALSKRLTVDAGKDLSTMPDAEVIHIAEQTLTEQPYTASCVTCHNPHKKTGNLSDDGKEVQLRKPVFNTDLGPIDASSTPQEFLNYQQVCAQCHNGRGANPSDATLLTGTSRPNMHDSNQHNMLLGSQGVEGDGPVVRNTAHANVPGQCSTCHMPSSRHSYRVSFDKGCQPCHTAQDAAARTAVTKDETISGLYALRSRMANWAQQTFGDPMFWEYTSNISAEGKTPPSQSLVPIEIKRARHNYYFVVRDGSLGVHNSPYAQHLIRVANQNLDALGGAAAPARSTVSIEEMRRVLAQDRARSRALHSLLED